MTRGWRAGIAALALAAIAAGIAWMLQTPGDPTIPGDVRPETPAAPSPAATAPVIEPTRADSVVPDTRVAAVPAERAAPPATESPQGFRGIVVDENGRPLPGLEVFLVDSAGNDPVALPLLRQQRFAFGPVASAHSGSDGAFALGLPVAQERIYELCVLSATHAITRLGGLRLLADQWTDVGLVTMVAGATIRGRVTVAGRDDMPVPQATVTVEIGSTFADAALRALPGAAAGLVAHVDASGAYELRHVPSRGAVQVAAVAPGFARVAKANIELSVDRPVQVDFGLPPGEVVGGTVASSDGRTIAGARVEAWVQKAASPPLVAYADDNGAFEVLGLVNAVYRLRVSARGFETHDEPEIQPGRRDVRVVLHARSTVRVRVETPTGEVVRKYRLGLRRYFAEQRGQIAAVIDVPEQRVRLDGMTDFATIHDVPIGMFVCQVEVDGFAKTLSEPFDNRREPGSPLGPRQFDVVVRIGPGATLRGTVVDENGLPLADATVTTQADGALPDSPFFRIVAGTLPDRVTTLRVTTGPDGAFVLSRLALGDYQLLVEHAAACRKFVPGLRLDDTGERTVPPIQLIGGAVVAGRVTVAGRVAGQVKVVLSTAATAANTHDAIRLETATDATGAFRMPRRVPPGTYALAAAVVGTTEPEAQIFHQLLQLQRSSTPVVIAPGQSLVEHTIDLPSDH